MSSAKLNVSSLIDDIFERYSLLMLLLGFLEIDKQKTWKRLGKVWFPQIHITYT